MGRFKCLPTVNGEVDSYAFVGYEKMEVLGLCTPMAPGQRVTCPVMVELQLEPGGEADEAGEARQAMKVEVPTMYTVAVVVKVRHVISAQQDPTSTALSERIPSPTSHGTASNFALGCVLKRSAAALTAPLTALTLLRTEHVLDVSATMVTTVMFRPWPAAPWIGLAYPHTHRRYYTVLSRPSWGGTRCSAVWLGHGRGARHRAAFPGPSRRSVDCSGDHEWDAVTALSASPSLGIHRRNSAPSHSPG
ncbi:hypothetical protein B0J11DRAFT_506397 [Dendryphion nanum]|uniref:Uncharacterized protein n=1 Tax=Dendryphion nanum TaxID=256645 RepID=A0A9P9IM56_9PLEO|nr:hypothetical protein B0J11DRAFT_506397 [Dendryphion nanum]